MEPRKKINCHPVNHTPQPDFRIQQSLEILQNIPKTNLQIVTVISHCFNNHQADSCHFPHVHPSTKDRSHDLPQQVSHTPLSHASPYEHVKPISRHLTPDTLHQPLSPPTPQVQYQDPESADPPLSAVWSLPRFFQSSQERVDQPPAGDRFRSFLFPRQVPTGQFYELTTGPLTNQATSPVRPESREAEDCSRHEYTEDHPRSTRGTEDTDTNSPPTITNSEIPRPACRNSIKDHITDSAESSSSSDDDIPDLQSSSTDSESEQLLTGRFWVDSDKEEQPDDVPASISATPYWSAPDSGQYDTPAEQENFMCQPKNKPCPQPYEDFLFNATPASTRSARKRKPHAKKNLNILFTTEALLLDEACARNEILLTWRSEFCQHQLLLLCQSEEVTRNTIQVDALCFHRMSNRLVEAEQDQRKAVQSEVFAGLTPLASRTLSGEHRSILARSLTAYISLTIVLFEDHKEGLRRIILLEEDSRRYKGCGPLHLSPSRRVLGAVIKHHQRDRPFSNAWRHMATVNSMSSDSVVLDPFRFQETVLRNFLRSQGLLPGPCIRHFPHKVSTSPCSWADATDNDPSCNVPEPVDSKKAEEQLQHKFSKDISEFSISFETPWSTSTDLLHSLLFYSIQWPESVMRAKITLEGQCDLATCLSDNISMLALNHLQVLLSDFIDFD